MSHRMVISMFQSLWAKQKEKQNFTSPTRVKWQLSIFSWTLLVELTWFRIGAIFRFWYHFWRFPQKLYFYKIFKFNFFGSIWAAGTFYQKVSNFVEMTKILKGSRRNIWVNILNWLQMSLSTNLFIYLEGSVLNFKEVIRSNWRRFHKIKAWDTLDQNSTWI